MVKIEFDKRKMDLLRSLGLIVISLFAFYLALATNERSIYTSKITIESFQKELKHPWNGVKYNGEMKFNFSYDYSVINSSVLNIVPDDKLLSIRVNGQEVNLSSVPSLKLQDWRRGFDFDFKKYLKFGVNDFEIKIFNTSGGGGLAINEKVSSISILITLLLYSFGFGMILWVFLRRLNFSIPEISLFIIWAILASWYMIYTPYNVRIFDVYQGGGHMDYIQFLKNDLIFPNPGEGWEYHQPPLYYIFASLVVAIVDNLLAVNYTEALRIFSTIIFSFFLIYACRIIRIVIKAEKLKLLLFSIVLFWPAGIIHASRIGNDGFMYLFCTAGFFHLYKWWINRKSKHFYWSLGFLFLTLLSKSSGIILAGALFGVLLNLVLRKGVKSNIKPIVLSFVVIFVAMGINLGDNIYYASKNNSPDWLLVNVGNSISKNLKVENNFINYAYFDIPTFLTEAYTDTWNDKGGRQYFWNFLLKSSLFSEFQFKSVFHKTLAIIMSYVLLIILIFSIVIMFRKLKINDLYKIAPLLWFVLASIIALSAYRIKVPVSCNGDFRYIYPVLVASVAIYGYLLNKKTWKVPSNISKVLAVGFYLVSILFFASWGFVGIWC